MVSERVEKAIERFGAASYCFGLAGLATTNQSKRERNAARAALITAIEAEVGAETVRCANIVGAARFNEIDRDWRSIIGLIESNYVHVSDSDEP